MNYKKIIRATIISLVLLMGTLSIKVNYVLAADATQTMSPEQLAQERARQEELARVEQQAREQAATAEAALAAQARAQQEEASSLYLQWGASAGDYNYSQDVTNFLAGNNNANAAALNTSALALSNAALMSTVQLPVVSKINPASLGIKTVDLIIFAGQSNMSGAGGNPSQAPKVSNKAGFEFRAASDPTGFYPITEPFGGRENGYAGESSQVKHGSLVSSFVNTYYARTGTPVVAISASRGGSDSSYWAGTAARQDLFSRFTKAKTYLTANGYTIRHSYLVWLQGESDSNGKVTPSQYTANLNAAFSALFNSGLEQVFIITPGYAQGGVINYDQIVATQKNMCLTSNRYTLASEKLRTFPITSEYMADAVHYNQKSLNLVGADAAARVALGY